jgi:hypothetical protein
MPEPTEDAKSSGTESAATGSPLGTDDFTASLSMWSRAHMVAATRLKTASGVVGERTAVTPGETILDHNSPLSAADEQRLHRIRKDRANGFMVSAPDVDFLLEMVERLSR